MKNRKFMTGIALAVLLGSCGQSKQEEKMVVSSDIMSEEALDEKSPSDYISSSAAVEKKQDTARKFIRTAELRFRVKDVIQSTYDIEGITGRQGGFVTFTNLKSEIDRVTTTNISADSSLASTYYMVVNNMTLRVPNVRLDTTLKEIARNIDFLDYRIISAQDVALQLFANNLTQKRIAKNEQRLADAIDRHGRKLDEATRAEEFLLDKQEQADNAKISNLSLADQISFSSVNLSIYQRQTIKREIVANDKNIEAYEPGTGVKLVESLRYGWNILAAFVIFIAKFWGLILLGIVVCIVYRKYGHKLKSKK